MSDTSQNSEETPETEPTADVAETATPSSAEPAPVLDPKARRQARRGAAVAKRGPRRAPTPEARAEARAQKAAQRRRYRARLKAKRAERETTPPPEPTEHAKGAAKLRTGIVVSDKADKTITVRIETARRHRRYQKTIRSSTTLHAHDEANDANAGDRVRVVESRPLSRLKRWRLDEVLERAR